MMADMDYASWYRKVSAPFRGAGARRALDVLDRGLVAIIAAGYIGMLVWLAVAGDARFWKALLVPAVTFALVTVLRAALDWPRPYAAHDIDPILVKERQGKSFPSRHVSSAVIIACTLLWLDAAWGIPALVACRRDAHHRRCALPPRRGRGHHHLARMRSGGIPRHPIATPASYGPSNARHRIANRIGDTRNPRLQ